MNGSSKKIKINITPNASLYLQFKYRTYKMYKAIAGYIDNSTQSFFDNKNKFDKNYILKININYSSKEIIIKDNAYGMNKEEFANALKLGELPKSNAGRNQFGMGLKLFSCWFANVWYLESTQFGNNKLYKTKFDVNLIAQTSKNELEIEELDCHIKETGTKVVLKQLNKKIVGTSAKSLSKILASIYRNDIKNHKIEIIINGKKLKYITPKIWPSTYGNKYQYSPKSKSFEFDREFENQKYRVKGNVFIAFMATTNKYTYGFDFMKNDRVIINNFKEEILSGKANTFSYQRLFGEIELFNVGVTQDKSDFDWHTGLKDEIVGEIAKTQNQFRK